MAEDCTKMVFPCYLIQMPGTLPSSEGGGTESCFAAGQLGAQGPPLLVLIIQGHTSLPLPVKHLSPINPVYLCPRKSTEN